MPVLARVCAEDGDEDGRRQQRTRRREGSRGVCPGAHPVFPGAHRAFVVLVAQRAAHGPARQTLPQVVAGTRDGEAVL
jgi:hypothetical protein